MAALIWCPFADEDSAASIARQLLDEQLIACANILGRMRSIYRWQGETGDSEECGVLMKTDAALLGKAVARLEAIHPYETPAIMGWPCAETGVASRAWLAGLVAGAP